MPKTNEKCKELEQILRGRTSVVLELNSSKENIQILKNDLEKLDYQISREIKDKQQELYHIHVIKFPVYKND